jgi:glucoamylase
MPSLDQWIDQQYAYSAQAMLLSISPIEHVRVRPGFGQTIRPLRGSIVASPVPGSYDPDPDYFFHWYRDSAVVIDALRLLYADGSVGSEALTHVREFVHFSRAVDKLDGRALVADPSWREGVAQASRQYLRDEDELLAVHGAEVAAETRVNPDGSLDITRWARPQHDGPALRALALLHWVRTASADPEFCEHLSGCIHADLAFVFRKWREPCFDIWEEERGLHFYTLCAAAAALESGADWLQARELFEQAQSHREAAAAARRTLDGFWLADAGYYCSRQAVPDLQSAKSLDMAVVLAALHAGGRDAHSVHDPRMQATLARLEALFDAAYPINRSRPAARAPAMGRYAGDTYYCGGAYYFSTLGAAEFYFRAAAGREDRRAWITRGDEFLATVRAFTPLSGEMAEQFDQRTGEPRSARHLAWSYASFISCVNARRAALGISRC